MSTFHWKLAYLTIAELCATTKSWVDSPTGSSRIDTKNCLNGFLIVKLHRCSLYESCCLQLTLPRVVVLVETVRSTVRWEFPFHRLRQHLFIWSAVLLARFITQHFLIFTGSEIRVTLYFVQLIKYYHVSVSKRQNSQCHVLSIVIL